MSLPPLFQPLPWDTEFLGFGVARVAAAALPPAGWQQTQAAARAAGFRLLYVVADPADTLTAQTLAAGGLAPISRLVTYLAEAATLTAPPNPLHIVPTARLTPELEALAWESGAFSRFRLDPLMPATAFQRLYSEWLRKSLLGQELAREVFCARLGTGPEIGLLTLGVQQGRADIGLLAVASGCRGQGVGHQLLAAAGARTRAWGLSQVQVVTQFENQVACRFYANAGFGVACQQDVYHCWLL